MQLLTMKHQHLIHNLMLVTFSAVKVQVALIATPNVAGVGVIVIVGNDV